MTAAEFVAHGGTGGLILEGALFLGLLVLAIVVWRIERRVRSEDRNALNRFKSHFDDR
ncbi:hypothetical protein BH18ACT12_BH18ACT12_05250 [soil metagenome]